MKILATVLVLGSLMYASSLFAQTYQYVDTSGNVRVETATSAEVAIATAPNRASDSGVMEVTDHEAVAVVEKDRDSEAYAYVMANGEISVQVAETPNEAIVEAEDRKYDSGVMMVAK